MAKRTPSEALRRAANTFEDYLRVERGASPRTISAYKRDLGSYLGSLAAAGIENVADVMPTHVSSAMQARSKKGSAPSTLNRWLAAVRHFHKFCVREGFARSNPAALIDGPARGLSLPKALGAEEVNRIVEAASGDSAPELRDRVILELLYGAGLRVS